MSCRIPGHNHDGPCRATFVIQGRVIEFQSERLPDGTWVTTAAGQHEGRGKTVEEASRECVAAWFRSLPSTQ